jgi:Fe-S-cluster containining protein
MPTGRTSLPVVRLDAGGKGPAATADIRLSIGGEPVHLAVSVPTGPAVPRDLLPVFRGLDEVVIGVAVRSAERRGEAVSCRKGCGACCRQLVPVSESEARLLARLVEAMPEPRRSAVRARFADAVRVLGEAGLLDKLRDPGADSGRDLRPVGLAYFRLGVACPFLEEESCSIHPDRPLACREYLVTSPAEECARPSAEAVRTVPMPAGVAAAARSVDRDPAAGGAGWVPLVLALEWAAAHAAEPPPKPGPALLQEFFKRLTGNEVGGTPPA